MAFFDIFSKNQGKTKKEKQKIKIIIDYREKNSLVPSHLSSLNADIEFQQLSVGDYIINDTAIERKTFSDLKSSIVNKRIMSQLLELKQYPSYFLVLEGFEGNIYEGQIHENALRGFILSIISDYQVPIIFTKDEKDTAKYLLVLSNKKEKKNFSIRASKILLSQKEQAQYILEGFPNIGPVKAKALLSKFKTIKSMVNATDDELEEILGKKIKVFKDLINYKYPN